MFSPSAGGQGINNPHNLGSGRGSGSPSILRTQQIANITRISMTSLDKQKNTDMIRQRNIQMKNIEPNKHTKRD